MSVDDRPRVLTERRAYLLNRLAAVEREVWTRGGVDAHRRRAAVAAALTGGCGVPAVAAVLGVAAEDIHAWVRT